MSGYRIKRLAWILSGVMATWAGQPYHALALEEPMPAALASQPGESLSSAIQRVLAEHPDVRGRVFARGAAGELVTAAGSRRGPRVDLTGAAGRERQNDLVSTNAVETVSGPNQRLSLQVAQPVFDGFEASSQVERQSRIANIRYFEIRQVEDQLVSDLARAWIDVQRHAALRDISKEALANHQRLADLLRSRVESKVARGVDLDQALSRLALSTSTLESDEGALREARARFRRVSLRDAPEQLPGFEIPPSFLPGDERQAVEWALNARSELAIARENLAALGAEREATKAAYLPKVNLEARHDVNSRTALSPDARVSSLLLTLNYNLFAGGGDNARERDVALRLEQAREQLAQAGLDVRQSASSTWSEVVRQTNVLDRATDYARTVVKTKEAYRLQYDVGQRSLLDLLNNESEVAQARRMQVNARADALFARVRLLLLTGRAEEGLGFRRNLSEPEVSPAARAAGLDPLLSGLSQSPVTLGRIQSSGDAPAGVVSLPEPRAANAPTSPPARWVAEAPRSTLTPSAAPPSTAPLVAASQALASTQRIAAPRVTPKVVEPREISRPGVLPKAVEPRPATLAEVRPKSVEPRIPQSVGADAPRPGSTVTPMPSPSRDPRTFTRTEALPKPATPESNEHALELTEAPLSAGERSPPIQVLPGFGPGAHLASSPGELARAEAALVRPPAGAVPTTPTPVSPPVQTAQGRGGAEEVPVVPTEQPRNAKPRAQDSPEPLSVALNRWQSELSAQNMRGFFGLYSEGFRAAGMSEDTWRSEVGNWMRQPRPAQVRVMRKEVTASGDGTFRAGLVVRFDSPSGSRCQQYVQRWSSSGPTTPWLIDRERVTPAAPGACTG